MEFDIVEEDERERRPRADTSYRQVFALFYTKWPFHWNRARIQVEAAKNLLSERGISEVKNALRWYAKYKDNPFCPNIHTPYDLDTKWAKLEAFIERL